MIKGKITYSEEKYLYKSVTAGRKYFFGHDWSIPGEIDWESVLDRRSRQIQPLFLDFLHKNQVTTAEKHGRVFQEDDVTWGAS